LLVRSFSNLELALHLRISNHFSLISRASLACCHAPFLLLVKYVDCQLEGFTSFLAFSAESNAFLILLLYHLLHQELVSKQTFQ
jgi:hypothetical protein